MKLDFSLKALFVVDMWIAMSIITCIIIEMAISPSTNGLISTCILVSGVLVNLIVCAFIFQHRIKSRRNNYNKN